MRVLALVTDAFGSSGGIAQYNRDFLTALAETGADVVVQPRYAAAEVPVPARVRQLAPLGHRSAYAAAVLRNAFGARFDVVFCGHLYMAALALVAARIRRSRLVVQLHGIEAWTAPRRGARAAFARADLALAVSRFTRNAALGWSSLPPERIVVVPNTIREVFKPGDRMAAQSALGFTDEAVLLSVGRLDPRERYKGQDRVIDALPGLIAGGRRVAYVVAGDGGDRPRLESLARERGVAHAVRFVGEVGESGLPSLYRAADLFVLPSTGEGFGIVFLEAMASGTPALGLSAGGAPDALADGRLGTLATPESLDAAIADQLDRPEFDRNALAADVAARFGREPFRRAVARFAGRLAELT